MEPARRAWQPVGTLIDSSVLIAAERGTLDFEATRAAHGSDEVAIASITASELLHGVYRLQSAARRARAELLVGRLLRRLPIVAFDLDIARVHAMLSAELRSKGTAIGAHDLIIGATAVFLGVPVATRDLRSFPKIKGLDVQRW